MANEIVAEDKLKQKIKKWSEVDKSAYAIVFDLAKERLDDILKESESITDKSIKIVTALVAFVGFFSGYLLNNSSVVKNHQSLLAWCGIFTLINIGLLVSLILPKSVKARGLPPLVSLVNDFDDPDDKEKQIELVYYNSISVLQENIDYMLIKNQHRSKSYKIALIFFLLQVAVIPCIVTYVILHP